MKESKEKIERALEELLRNNRGRSLVVNQDLSNKNLENINYSLSKFINVYLVGARLYGASFVGVFFKNVNLKKTDLTDTNFDQAILGRINLGGTIYKVVLNIGNKN